MGLRAKLAFPLVFAALLWSGGAYGTVWAGLGHAVPSMPPQPGQGSAPSDPGPVGAPSQPGAPAQPTAPSEPQGPGQTGAPAAPIDPNAGSGGGTSASGASGSGGTSTGGVGGTGAGVTSGAATNPATGGASGATGGVQGAGAGSDAQYLGELDKAIVMWTRTQKFLQDELAKPGVPDPGKLQTVATATGQRGEFYKKSSDKVKKIIDDYERQIGNNIKDTLRLFWGWLPPNGGMNGVYRKHAPILMSHDSFKNLCYTYVQHKTFLGVSHG